MSDLQERGPKAGARTVIDKIKQYSVQAGKLGHRARKAVFGFRPRPTAEIDRWTLPVKPLQRHRILQRQRAFHQGGGNHCSMVQHGLEKARHGQQHP